MVFYMQDAVEFAASLQGVFSNAASSATLAGALRAIERKRACRTHDMLQRQPHLPQAHMAGVVLETSDSRGRLSGL